MSKVQSGSSESLSRIQTLVDDLCDALGRSVAVDNPSFELLCASAQVGPVDDRRVAAIIHRSPPPEPVPWMLSHGIQTSRVPVRLPANEDYGMLPRVCFPIRQEDSLSGYLWLFDEPPVADEEMETAGRAVAQLAQIMHADDAALQERADAARSLAAQAASRATSVSAVEQAAALGHLPEDGQLSVHVMRLHPATPQARVAVRDPQVELSRPRLERPYLVHYTPQRLVVIARNRTSRDTAAVLASIRRLMRIGVINIQATGSAAAGSPLDLEAAVDRADFAAELAALLGNRQDPLAWENAGSWRLLEGRSLDEATVYELSDDARALVQRGNRDHWQTVLAYLDSGRSTGPTCQTLSIHRATLHYRLERIREILGPEALDDGWRATSLHVGLKLYQALQTHAGHQTIRPAPTDTY